MELTEQLANALWRYVVTDSCDNDGPDDVCHFCEGVAALQAIGKDPVAWGWVESGECDTALLAPIYAKQTAETEATNE